VIYQEFTSYCPFRDCEVARLSTSDDRGAEFFALIPRPSGRGWRQLREEALTQMASAIAAGATPGEITINMDA
jgi:hypothetical protein